MKENLVGNVKKIAVLRANGVGDFVFCLPALSALRYVYPRAEIVILGKDWHIDFLKDRPGPFDRVISIPKSKGVNEDHLLNEDPHCLAAFFSSMQEENFDLAVQLHGGGRYSNPFVKKLGAKLTVGLKSADAIELDRWIPYIYFQNEVLRYLEVVQLVGASVRNIEPQLIVTKQDQDEVQGLNLKLNGLKPSVVLNPGAGDPRRRWPAESFAQVGDALASKKAQLIITGSKQEYDLCAEVESRMQADALNLAGQLSLRGLLALLAQSDLLISNDSGPLHLARALTTPTIGLYWCGNFINAGSMTTKNHRSLLSWILNCPECKAHCLENTCEHTSSFITAISSKEVIQEANMLLSL